MPNGPGDCADWAGNVSDLRDGPRTDGYCGRTTDRSRIRIHEEAVLGRNGAVAAVTCAFDVRSSAGVALGARSKEWAGTPFGVACGVVVRLAVLSAFLGFAR